MDDYKGNISRTQPLPTILTPKENWVGFRSLDTDGNSALHPHCGDCLLGHTHTRNR